MAPSIKKVVIVGAGGTIGKPILESVSKAGFNVTILSRKGSKSTFDGKYKVASISDDYPHGELVSAFKGHDAVISTINTFEVDTQKKLIDAAVEAGVYRFIPSEFGGDNRSTAATETAPIFQNKLQIVKHLQAQEGKITWTAIPTGAFYDWALGCQFTGFDVPNRKAKLTDNGATKFSTTTTTQIASWVATVLAHPEETANQYANVESFEVSQLDILKVLEKITGDKFEVEHQSGQDLIAGSKKSIAEGNIYGEFGLIQASLFVEGLGGNFHKQAVESMKKLGVSPLDLEEETKKLV